jgi:indole-3-glycerol phosphate synthase
VSASPRGWPERRFSQAISEGDGISVIPLLRGDLVELARAAEAAGAEALAVESVGDVRTLRGATDLPLLVHCGQPDVRALEEARAAGADACVLVFGEFAGDEELLEELVALAAELGLDCAVDVRDEDELAETLERLDPDILVLSERDAEEDEADLERTLDLLPDVPAGKLVISESRVTAREQILELERAGVDAVVVREPAQSVDFSVVLSELVGRGAGS